MGFRDELHVHSIFIAFIMESCRSIEDELIKTSRKVKDGRGMGRNF